MHVLNPTLWLALCLLFWGGTARADAVMPYMEACPNGSMGQPSHSGGYCQPRFWVGQCASEADCTDGKQCLEVSRCLYTWTGTTRSGGTYTGRRMYFPSADGGCDRGECTTMQVCTVVSSVGTDACVPPEAPAPDTTEEEAGGAAEGEAGPAATESAATATEQPVPVEAGPDPAASTADDDGSSCATAVAGMSAAMAGILGLVALGRRRV